jgi:hypothetical protein
MRRRAIGGVLLTVGLPAAALPVRSQSTSPYLTPEYLASIDDALLHGTITPPGAALTEKEKELRAYDDLVQLLLRAAIAGGQRPT